MPPRPAIGSPLVLTTKGETETYAKILENGHEITTKLIWDRCRFRKKRKCSNIFAHGGLQCEGENAYYVNVRFLGEFLWKN